MNKEPKTVNKDYKGLIKCRGSLDEDMKVKITRGQCINPNGIAIRGIWHICPKCKYYTY